MKFSEWQLFEGVDWAKVSSQKGVYAFAISNERLTVFSMEDKAIVYYGMTNSNDGLRGRLRQFRRALYGNGKRHSGAVRLRRDCVENFEGLKGSLFYAVCEYQTSSNQSYTDELRQMGEVAKAEYVAFAKYFEKYGRLPKYNVMKASPKK